MVTFMKLKIQFKGNYMSLKKMSLSEAILHIVFGVTLLLSISMLAWQFWVIALAWIFMGQINAKIGTEPVAQIALSLMLSLVLSTAVGFSLPFIIIFMLWAFYPHIKDLLDRLIAKHL